MVTTDPKKDQWQVSDVQGDLVFALLWLLLLRTMVNWENSWYVKEFCGPNLSAIANTGMPSDSGRKGGVEKRKRSKAGAVQSRSVWQCLQALTPSTMPSATSKTSPSTSCMVVSLSLSTHSGQLTQSSSQTPATPSCYVTPSCITTKTSATYPPQGPLQHQVGNPSNASVTPTASSNGQVLVGSNVFNFVGSSMPLIPCSSRFFTGFSSSPVSAVPHSTMSWVFLLSPFFWSLSTVAIPRASALQYKYADVKWHWVWMHWRTFPPFHISLFPISHFSFPHSYI